MRRRQDKNIKRVLCGDPLESHAPWVETEDEGRRGHDGFRALEGTGELQRRERARFFPVAGAERAAWLGPGRTEGGPRHEGGGGCQESGPRVERWVRESFA